MAALMIHEGTLTPHIVGLPVRPPHMKDFGQSSKGLGRSSAGVPCGYGGWSRTRAHQLAVSWSICRKSQVLTRFSWGKSEFMQRFPNSRLSIDSLKTQVRSSPRSATDGSQVGEVQDGSRSETDSTGSKEQRRDWVLILGKGILPLVILGVGVLLRVRPSSASIGALQEAATGPARKQLLAGAWTGLVAGCLHTLTGPDHLAALAPLCIGRSKLQSAAVGALWGCGHDTGQVLFGIIFLLLKDKLHLDLIRTWATRVVGFTLITIGVMGVKEAQEMPIPALAEEGGGFESFDQAGARVAPPRNFATFATGVVHGLQPDALLMVMPALALPSRLTGAAFLGMFLVGTVIAMGGYTLFIASCSEALQKKVPGITKRLTIGSACIAIALGSGLVLGEFLGISIFG